MKRWRAWILVAVLVLTRGVLAAADKCAVCGEVIEGTVYLWDDKVAGDKKRLCGKCVNLPRQCYLCSLPVLRDYTELPDGRVLCARDARAVVRNDEDAFQICREVKEALDRLFSRFIIFPETNVTLALADRVNLQQLFKTPGLDYVCPNVLGYIQTTTNSGRLTHAISLLSGLPRATLKATCAHEYTHAWVSENVPAGRKRTLDGDAEEGFCELVSYLLMESQGEEEEKKQIKANAYTRGQIHLFLDAEHRFGFNEIVEWMEYGDDGRLRKDDLGRVRQVTFPARTNPPAPFWLMPPVKPPPAPDRLILSGITWSKPRPMALVNGRNFEVQTQASVQVGKTNVTVRCLAIRENSVLLQIVDTGEQRELRLPSP
jgi:hypothetical protein